MKIMTIKSCGSTNESVKELIFQMKDPSPLPPALMALEQTSGKGRSGRSFESLRGKGLYLSMPFEIRSPEDALCIMPMTSVCVCRTLEALLPFRCQIKWPNDLLYDGRKLCGILTELVQHRKRFFIVIGIGINLTQEKDDFSEELRDKAVSLRQICGKSIDPQTLAEALVPSVEKMIKALPDGKAGYLNFYRSRCTAVGREISVLFSESSQPVKARAIDISDDFRLMVQWDDGRTGMHGSGEVSIR